MMTFTHLALPACSYHMCEIRKFERQLKEGGGRYFPPTYAQDGFVHCSSDPRMLLDIANAFYKSSPVTEEAEWAVLSLMTHQLGDVRFEAPAPVGGVTRAEDSDPSRTQPLFPHIYGPITAASVVRSFRMLRAADGTFLSIEGL